MKRNLLIIILLVVSPYGFSQVCTPNSSYTQVGIYPAVMPDGMVGQTYEQVLDFVLPTDTMGYDFTNFKILSVSLPVGLQWECNNAFNDCNYDPQVTVNGCGLVFGTPLVAGDYLVDVNVVADLTVAQGIPFSFQIPLTILPFQMNNSNDGFTMIGGFDCAPSVVSFTNNNPGLAAYSWDFGNGNTSSQENPGPQLYTNPGEYVVNYTAYANTDIVNVFTLNTVSVNALSGFGGGFPGFDSPDPYFILKENGQTVYQSTIVDGAIFPSNWSLNIILDPANSYVIEVWEADESNTEIFFGSDDYMGQTSLNLAGCSGCVLTGGGSSGGNVSYVITNQTILPNPSVLSTDTVIVLGYPDVPFIEYDQVQNNMLTEDLGYVYQWYFNGVAIPGASSNTHTPQESGSYTVAAFNIGGCSTTSLPVIGVVCTDYQPGIFSSSNEVVLSNPMTNGTNQWFFNGNPITGATGNSVELSGLGDYSVTVTDSFGCEYTSTFISFSVGIESPGAPSWSIFPNPAEVKVNVTIQNGISVRKIEITDMTGRVVQSISTSKSSNLLDISDLPSGVYFVQLISDQNTFTKKLIKR